MIGPPISNPKSLIFWIGLPEVAPWRRRSSVMLTDCMLSSVR
jgi:hypothetical protein